MQSYLGLTHYCHAHTGFCTNAFKVLSIYKINHPSKLERHGQNRKPAKHCPSSVFSPNPGEQKGQALFVFAEPLFGYPTPGPQSRPSLSPRNYLTFYPGTPGSTPFFIPEASPFLVKIYCTFTWGPRSPTEGCFKFTFPLDSI